MKQRIFFFFLLLLFYCAKAQNILIGSSVKFVTTGNIGVVLQNMGINSANTNDFSGSDLYLRGNNNATITTNGNFSFRNLYIDKPSASVFLGSPVSISNGINMVNGLLDLNNNIVTLSSTATINGETEATHITGLNGGEVAISLNLTSPNAINAGNLGAIITSTSDLGLVTISRGHKTQTGSGLTGSINRYFKISPANNSSLNATLRFVYLDVELNGQTESGLNLFNSNDNGTTWNNQTFTIRDVVTNYVEKNSITSLSEYTLSSVSGALPVVGLEFTAHRIDRNNVLLNWKTIQEINNNGFFIERRKENENSFSSVNFVHTKALGGNSNLPLNYSIIDSNSFAGITYYRIRQTDIDNHFIYSVVVPVKGEKGLITMTAYPVPASDHVSFVVHGIDRNEIVEVVDINGRVIKLLTVSNDAPQTIYSLWPGTYFLRLKDRGVDAKILIR